MPSRGVIQFRCAPHPSQFQSVETTVVLIFVPAAAVQPMQTNTVWLQFLQSSLTNPVGASVAAQILHLMLSLFSQSLVRYSKNYAGSAVCFCEWSTTADSSDKGDAGACAAAVFLLAALLSLSDLLPATLSTAGVVCSFF